MQIFCETVFNLYREGRRSLSGSTKFSMRLRVNRIILITIEITSINKVL